MSFEFQFKTINHFSQNFCHNYVKQSTDNEVNVIHDNKFENWNRRTL